MNTVCPICCKQYTRLSKHITECHHELATEQESLVLQRYRAGLSAREIASCDDIYFNGGTSVLRILRKHISAAELEEGRKERIGRTFKTLYADGELEHVKAINTDRARLPESRAKNSAGLKRAYANGDKVSWSLGKTKLTDARLLDMSEKLSSTMKAKADAGELNTLFRAGADAPNWQGGVSERNLRIRSGVEFTAGDRHLVLRNAGYTCQQCGKTAEQLDFEKGLLSMERWTLECDHIIPVHAGGNADPVMNGQALCSECHLRKSLSERDADLQGVMRRYHGVDHSVIASIFGGEIVSGVVKIRNISASIIDNRCSYDRNHIIKLKIDNPESIIIYRDEWLTRSKIIKSMIDHRLGVTDNVFHARKLLVKNLSVDERRTFFEKNHIAGDTSAIYCAGLVSSDGTVISAVSFRRPFSHTAKGVIELARSATAIGSHVNGGLSKLLSYCRPHLRESGFDTVLSYSDSRFGRGNSYAMVGFTEISKTKQDYYYTDGYRRFGRFKFRARAGVSEQAVAEEAGVHRLWGLGHHKYMMSI